ncbi:hypothetical protein NCC78_23615 [Micromonospora phytophila]|uniref:hypothetical protein n=1 Tax=Micromonospora phytophila TaxID=709888 RepID=UPI00202DD225|nr:hypothetical protein [Micromonospora phytophila]MCM0677652.1 hypothetical protein [Micromonospora phytophila]
MDLGGAMRALRAADEALPQAEEHAAQLARQVKAEARARVEQARAELHRAIVAEYRAGARQVDLVKRTGYSRERVRQILRAGGVEAD